MPEQKRPVLLRLNIPFCAFQCDFCSRRALPGWDAGRLERYCQALERELAANRETFSDCQVQALRIGGGNATALTGEELWSLYACVRENFSLADPCPVTILASPFQISGGRLAFYNRIPVARYDYEVYSLSAMDRWLPFPDGMEKLRIAGAMTHAEEQGTMGGILLLGHPQQAHRDLHRSIRDFLRLPISHLMFQRHPQAGPETALTLEDRQTLENAGMTEYLPNCWVLPGREDRYLLGKVRGLDELSFGLGARTVFSGAVSENTWELDRYLEYSNCFEQITAAAYPQTQ